jgi:hypothetical protein
MPALDVQWGVEFNMDEGPKMLSFSTTKDRLVTPGVSTCTVAIIASQTQVFAIHVSRGRYQIDATGHYAPIPGQSAAEMGAAAATQLVELWRANRVAGAVYKSVLTSAAAAVDDEGRDDVVLAMYPILLAAVGNCGWDRHNGVEGRAAGKFGVLRIRQVNSEYPNVALDEGECVGWL